jgi:hypothetical protein
MNNISNRAVVIVVFPFFVFVWEKLWISNREVRHE